VSVEVKHKKGFSFTITNPQATQSVGKKILGPILYVTTVAGGWNIVYVTKKTSVAIEYR
jgi:hypothetical protein